MTLDREAVRRMLDRAIDGAEKVDNLDWREQVVIAMLDQLVDDLDDEYQKLAYATVAAHCDKFK